MSSIVTVTLNPALDKSGTAKQVVPERKLRCSRPSFHPGGGGINVARAVAELGERATAYWTCGGAVGSHIKHLLDKEAIAHQPIPIEALTRENLIVFEESSEQQFRFGFPGASLTQRETEECVNVLRAIDPVPDYLVLSGSLPPGTDDAIYARIIGEMPASCRVVLDTRGKALELGLTSSVFLVKPNLRELEELAGRSLDNATDIRNVSRQFIEEGKAQVVVTSLGSGGVELTTSEFHRHITAPTVKIRSKVGAGDSTVAGIVVALSRESSIAEAVCFGVAAGAAAVMTGGTELCRREDTERLSAEMQAS